MAAPHTDPIRDLNNFLQGQPGPGGNMTQDFKWTFMKEGPEHDALYHVTAVCKHSLCDDAQPLFFLTFRYYTTVRGVNIGVGHGPSKTAGKRRASVQALEYLRSCGGGDW
jgi:hypothetical protein